MRIALISENFPPLRTSGAVQLRDLSREIARQGHLLTVLVPTAGLTGPWKIDEGDGFRILRLRAPELKNIGRVRRTFNEILMPFYMLRGLRMSPLATSKWDGVIWYAPSIFFGPLVSYLKKTSGCRSYLIIRDIFPQWAVDVGLMRRGALYLFFNFVSNQQYLLADVIGVQTKGNEKYFERWRHKAGRSLQVLPNWLDKPGRLVCSIQLSSTTLAGRRVFVYAGNMGIAQDIDIFLDLADQMSCRADIGFLFVGRGSEAGRLRQALYSRKLDNVLFHDEIDPDEIPGLYAQCSVGIVALDRRHKSHNIPGKFLSYIQSGLPVLACVNPGNDLATLIKQERVGLVSESYQVSDLRELAERLLSEIEAADDYSGRCRSLFEREFSVGRAARQIMSALDG